MLHVFGTAKLDDLHMMAHHSSHYSGGNVTPISGPLVIEFMEPLYVGGGKAKDLWASLPSVKARGCSYLGGSV